MNGIRDGTRQRASCRAGKMIARTQGGQLMCRVFADQDPESYRVVTRSIRLNGYCTSIRLEAMFWSILDDIAAGQGMSTPRFISSSMTR
jgi:hypothetical protein